jgi:hypothetical protein
VTVTAAAMTHAARSLRLPVVLGSAPVGEVENVERIAAYGMLSHSSLSAFDAESGPDVLRLKSTEFAHPLLSENCHLGVIFHFTFCQELAIPHRHLSV